MSSLVYRISCVLCRILAKTPVGTNLALFHLLWMLLSGRLLRSRGAVIPGLADSTLTTRQVRRAWASLPYGRWQTQHLLDTFERLVLEEGAFQACRHGGFRVVACDLVGFMRPRLQGCQTKHYWSTAARSVPAIPWGVAGPVGQVGSQRCLIPRHLVRADGEQDDPSGHMRRLLETVAASLAPDEALVADRGFSLAQIQQAGIAHYVVRARSSFTARRAQTPTYAGTGRKPRYGPRVRPLPRKRQGRVIDASPCDRQEQWEQPTPKGSVTVRAQFWDDLVLCDAPANAPRFSAIVLQDAQYKEALLLVTNLALDGPQAYAFYHDRWPVEVVPLVAKQLLGAARQFVFSPSSRQRLPELALLAGSVLSYLAATLPAQPSGFWDRNPKPTAGRLRRALERMDLAFIPVPDPRVRKKASRTDHLPKGVAGHRRHKAGRELAQAPRSVP